MKLTAQIKLRPTEEQFDLLQQTLEIANDACNYISNTAWQEKVFSQFKLHKLVYYDVRKQFNLSAQMAVRCIAKVADAYKLDKQTKRTFKQTGGIAYDSRLLSYNLTDSTVSIWTLDGRIKVPFVCGDRQRKLLEHQQGESDLILFQGNFYLLATCDVDDPDPIDVEGVLGVDLGIVNIATDSDGKQYSGSQVLSIRKRRRRQRKRLQTKQTKSAKRRLKKLSGKERRFAKDVNHCTSKQIVQKAQDTNRAIALEDLKGIRQRARLRKPQREDLHSWSFSQLGQFITYKAQRAGIPVVFVDPKYTSQTCSVCGCIDKANRNSQDKFLCQSCGAAAHADCNAAVNIAVRGWPAVNQANVSVPLSGV